MQTNRRNFLQNAGRLTAGLGLASMPGSGMASDFLKDATIKPSANETVRVALIGCKNMRWADLSSLLKHNGVECLALCDVDSNILNSRAAELEKRWGKKPLLYSDYRKLLENKDIDAVIIGTPDHWHCLQMINACEAGKDVYVEKPIFNTVILMVIWHT